MGSGIVRDMAKPSSLERSSSKLADELHKPVIKKFNKRKLYSQFKDNLGGGGWGGGRFSRYAIIK